jgi:hypothetical protein
MRCDCSNTPDSCPILLADASSLEDIGDFSRVPSTRLFLTDGRGHKGDGAPRFPAGPILKAALTCHLQNDLAGREAKFEVKQDLRER